MVYYGLQRLPTLFFLCLFYFILFCYFDHLILSLFWIGLDEFLSWLDVRVFVISKIGLNVKSLLNLVELSLVLLI